MNIFSKCFGIQASFHFSVPTLAPLLQTLQQNALSPAFISGCAYTTLNSFSNRFIYLCAFQKDFAKTCKHFQGKYSYTKSSYISLEDTKCEFKSYKPFFFNFFFLLVLVYLSLIQFCCQKGKWMSEERKIVKVSNGNYINNCSEDLLALLLESFMSTVKQNRALSILLTKRNKRLYLQALLNRGVSHLLHTPCLLLIMLSFPSSKAKLPS